MVTGSQRMVSVDRGDVGFADDRIRRSLNG